MRRMNISNSDTVIDSRQVIERLAELAEQFQDHANGGDSPALDEDEKAELDALTALANEAEASPDWQYGEVLIRRDYFPNYAKQLAEDIAALPEFPQWPFDHIDWEAAAEALEEDYFEVTFDGVQYLIRN